jgi:sugar phosphate isomerase/epimerase
MTKLSIGVFTSLGEKPEETFAAVREMGLASCQLGCWRPLNVSRELVEANRAAAEAAGVTITAFWCGYRGPAAWNYIDGPSTIGLVPAEYRAMRVEDLTRGAEITAWLGIQDMATHVGFLPMNPKDPDYLGAVDAIRDIAAYAGERGVYFNFETGQETPTVLLRCIQDVGLPNLGVNLDPANLLLYGNANPVDALDIFGQYVRGVHAKDGDYPTDGHHLGEEKALGDGRVNFPLLVAKLKACGYAGALTIEREISGPQQIEDIKRAIAVLTPLL